MSTVVRFGADRPCAIDGIGVVHEPADTGEILVDKAHRIRSPGGVPKLIAYA